MDGTSAQLRGSLFRGRLLAPDVPRAGDTAAVVENCGCGPASFESGALVRVGENAVNATVYCEYCGVPHTGWIVEVTPIDDIGMDEPRQVRGYPLSWLQRVLPIGHADASHKQILTS